MTPEPMDAVRDVVVNLLSKHEGDSSKTLEEFLEKASKRMGSGDVPNEVFNTVNSILMSLSPLQDEADHLEVGRRISKHDIYNSLINDTVRQMNTLVGEDLYEEVEDDYTGDRMEAYKQALIKLESKLPHSKGKERDSIFWNISKLNSMLGGGEE